MKRKALYSRATRGRKKSASLLQGSEPAPSFLEDDFQDGPSLGAIGWAATRRFVARHDRAASIALSIAIMLLVYVGFSLVFPTPAALTQWDIDNAVKYTLEHTPDGPAQTTIAAATVAPSLVRVDGFLSPEHAAQVAKEEAAAEKLAEKHGKKPPKLPSHPANPDDVHPDSTGSGVVIDEKGNILTNLHVISSTDRWEITFADGSKSEAILITTKPETDLAVIRAKKVPDELKPATLASTKDLLPGDTVVAVGFPFGIGPSVSAGVVAGLKREFADPDDKDKSSMKNLIQFDAAVNPGNSGGPLVNRDGEVVGIVTAIYNPSGARVFAGMAFAVPIENAASAVGQNPL